MTTWIDSQEWCHREYGWIPSPIAAYGRIWSKNQGDHRCLLICVKLLAWCFLPPWGITRSGISCSPCPTWWCLTCPPLLQSVPSKYSQCCNGCDTLGNYGNLWFEIQPWKFIIFFKYYLIFLNLLLEEALMKMFFSLGTPCLCNNLLQQWCNYQGAFLFPLTRNQFFAHLLFFNQLHPFLGLLVI